MIIDKTALKAFVAEKLPTNGNKMVSAAKERTALNEIIDKVVDAINNMGMGGGSGSSYSTMTLPEAQAEASTNPRVITAKVLGDYVKYKLETAPQGEASSQNTIYNNTAFCNDLELPLEGYISQETHSFVEVVGGTFKCSGFVYVRGLKTIEFSARSYTEAGDSCQMCFYDSSKNVISSLDIRENDGITRTIDLTDSAYADVYFIVMSAYMPGWSGSRTYLRLKGAFDYSKFLNTDEIKYKSGYNLFDVSRVEREMGLASTGSYVIDTNAISSHLIELPDDRGRNGDLFLFNLPVTTYSKRFIYYDENMNVVAGPSDIAASDTSAQIGCRSNAKYFRITFIRATSPLPDEEDTLEMLKDVMITFQYSMTEQQPFYRNVDSINGVGINASKISGLYKGKKWAVIGDSLTERNSHSTKFYHDFVKEDLGFTVVNMGVSGTGYKTRDDVANPATEGAFYQRVSQIPSDADVVTIFGSFNDMTQSHTLGTPSDTGTTTICGCINTTIENIYAINPAMKLGIIAPCPWKEMNPSNADAVAYVEALETICKNNSIPFLNLFYESGLRPWIREVRDLVYDLDAQTGGDFHGTHPNAIGHEMLGSRIREFIQTLI